MYEELVVDGAEKSMGRCWEIAFEQKLERYEVVIRSVVCGRFAYDIRLREDIVTF